jgi:hypothetical protein
MTHRRRCRSSALALLLIWLIAAYVIMPWDWRRYVRRHPKLAELPNITHTADGIPGDPLNVLLIGREADLKRIMQAAGWFEADPLGLWSDLTIAADTVLNRPDERAPVSNLYLFGRKEDLAFQQPVGNSPRHRHHVRFWLKSNGGDPMWIGSAVYDKGVGFSHTTGQITHHTAAGIDAERDYLLWALKQTDQLLESYYVDDFHQIRRGTNGGGDPWQTDGRLAVCVMASSKQ